MNDDRNHDDSELDPFDLPASYLPEEELQRPTPRPIPRRLREGSHPTAQKRTILALVLAGAGCLALSEVPFIEDLNLYLLPLAYLQWIGLGLLAWGTGLWAWNQIFPGPFRYVVHGVPAPARVMNLTKAPALIYNGQATHYTITATVAMWHPVTAERVFMELPSGKFPASQKDRFTTSFSVGEVVTVIHLPKDPEASLRLYGFLGLNPDVGLVPVAGAETEKPSTLAGTLVAVAALFVALFWNVYAYARYSPIAPDVRAAALPMILGGLLLGGGFLIATFIGHRRERQRQEAANRQAIESGRPLELGASGFWGQPGWMNRGLTLVIIAGALLLGAVTALVWAWSANALLDHGEMAAVEVEVVRTEQTTESWIFRSYVVVYRFPGRPEESEYHATPDELALFTGPHAIAEVMPGRFGWPWVRALRPYSP